MQNFGFVLCFVIIFIQNTGAMLSDCCQITEEEFGPFTIHNDEKKVEKLVIQYSRTQARNTVLTSLLDLWNEIWDEKPELIDFQTVSNEDKLFMCKRSLNLNYFGFSFEVDQAEKMDIALYTISLRHEKTKRLRTRELFMFSCPKLQYTDLETNEVTILPITYFVSSTHLQNSYFLYLQERKNLPIYPHKFISQAYLDMIENLRYTDEVNTKLDEENNGQMSAFTWPLTAEDELSKFTAVRQLRKVYKKFYITFKNINVCLYSRVQKIGLCRYVARHTIENEIEYRGYDDREARCQKLAVFSNPRTSQDRSYLIGHFAMIKCPPLLYKTSANKNELSLKSIFLTTCKDSRSMLMYQRLNLRQQKIKPYSIIFSLRIEALEKYKRRIREFMKPDYIQITPHDSEEEVFQLSGSIIRPRQLSISFDRAQIEDDTIAFMKMKVMKKAYSRFRLSYALISTNTWLRVDIANLCYDILENEPYKLSFEINRSNRVNRLQIEVNIVMREAEELLSNQLVSSQCPPVIETTSTYFIVESLRKRNAVLLYVKYATETYAIPDAIISNVNKKNSLKLHDLDSRPLLLV